MSDSSQKTILIVDDETEVVELTSHVLAKRNYTISSVSTGEDALEALKNPPYPDLIIIDYRLPGQNGDAIIHELKSAEETKHIPILMCTAQVLMKSPTGGNPRLIRPDDYLIKPFEIEELLDKVETLIN